MAKLRTNIGTVIAMVFFLAAPLAHAGGERSFEANAIEYNVSASPQMTSRKFKSKVSISDKGAVKIVKIKNFVNKKSKPDITITIAMSPNSVGSRILNKDGLVVAEYPKGEVVNRNLFVFRQSSGNRQIEGRWFIADDYLMSDFTINAENGVLVYKETVIYRAR